VVNGSYAGVSSAFFDVLRLPIASGRGFTAGDRYGAPLVTVVSDSVAARLWPGADPIGKRLMFGNEGHWLTVVGVSAEPVTTPDTGAVCKACVVFVPFSQRYKAQMVMMIRPRGTSDMTPQLTSALAAVDPDVIPFEPGALDSTLLAALWLERAMLILVAAPGAVAILIAAFGIYSTTSYIVTLRSFEIAVRMALGAGPGAVVGLVMREVRLVCLIGLLAGVFIVASGERGLLASGTRFMPNDIPTWTIVSLMLVGVTTLAAYIPARRSTRVSPAAVLRK
jgi:hypothetical protein